MKRLASILLVLTMALSLAACGEGGLSLNPGGGSGEPGLKKGFVGDTPVVLSLIHISEPTRP